ncbi:MAG: NBR1-Ig-like domain-containing protein [Anaerolineaceae bacterium]
MKRNFLYILVLLTLSAVLLSACAPATPTVDPNAEITKIANTVQAQLTQISLLTPSATATPQPSATPTKIPATATPSGPTLTPTKTAFPTLAGGTKGDNSKFAGDITVPDGTIFTAGTTFTKTWAFTNTGNTTWTKDYKLIYLDGNITGKNGVLSVNLPGDIKPGETLKISVDFLAPAANATYTSYWRLYSASGSLFGEPCNIVFAVGVAATTPTISPTASGTP